MDPWARYPQQVAPHANAQRVICAGEHVINTFSGHLLFVRFHADLTAPTQRADQLLAAPETLDSFGQATENIKLFVMKTVRPDNLSHTMAL